MRTAQTAAVQRQFRPWKSVAQYYIDAVVVDVGATSHDERTPSELAQSPRETPAIFLQIATWNAVSRQGLRLW